MLAMKGMQNQARERRVWRAGLTAMVLALAVNGVIRTITMWLVDVSPDFRPFTWPQLALFTVLGVGGATVLSAWLSARAARPAETFRKIALVVLALSIVPDIALLVTQAVPGITPATFAALVLMHVATAIISIHMLAGCPRLAK